VKAVFVKVEWFGSPGKPYGESGEDFHTEAMMEEIAASPWNPGASTWFGYVVCGVAGTLASLYSTLVH